jgi:transcriptional regulator with XRE-family HTH domain
LLFDCGTPLKKPRDPTYRASRSGRLGKAVQAACGDGRDIVALIADYCGISFQQAREILRSDNPTASTIVRVAGAVGVREGEILERLKQEWQRG